MPLEYHAGQIAVQTEANTRPVADKLAHWVGPIVEFMDVADLIVLATPSADGRLRFTAIGGRAPLIEVLGGASVALPVALPVAMPGESVPVGGLAIALAQRRRARLNGELTVGDDRTVLDAAEAFTNCRKYVAPSEAIETETRIGPSRRERVALGDPWLHGVLARAETSFLATVSPSGMPDVSHRGGPPGFLSLDAPSATLTWSEFVGDGMLKSAGNVRANGQITLLVIDLPTGDAAELTGQATYETLMTRQRARTEGLERHRDPFPPQGRIAMKIETSERLSALMPSRRPIDLAKLNSSSPLEEQEPQ